MIAILLLSVLLFFAPVPVAEAQVSLSWYKTPSTTVLDKGAGAAWDNGGVGTVSVILDVDTYKMWYTGYDSTNGLLQIGYATSANGKTWTRGNDGNPVLSPSGANEAEGVGAPRVILDDATYKMWYTGYKPVGSEFVPQIFYATSNDGISWNRQNDGIPVLTPGGAGFDERGVHSAAVIKDGATFKMWYTGRGGTGLLGTSSIGYATSSDGIIWAKDGFFPVLSGTAGQWNADGVAVPSVIKTDKYYMWFSGYAGLTRGTIQVKIGGAESTDGTTWTNVSAVLDKAASGWSAGGVGAPWVLNHVASGALEMWYSGLDSNLDSRLGYAVAGNQTLTLTAVLQGDGRLTEPTNGYDIPLTFKVYDAAVTNLNIKTLAYLAEFSTADENIAITQITPATKTITFTVSGVPAGTFNVTLYSPHTLVNLKNNANVPVSGGGSFSMGTLLEGDAQDIGAGSVVIDFTDFVAFGNAYETQSGMANWNANADFDRNGWVKIADFGLLYMNYGKTSPQTI